MPFLCGENTATITFLESSPCPLIFLLPVAFNSSLFSKESSLGWFVFLLGYAVALSFIKRKKSFKDLVN